LELVFDLKEILMRFSLSGRLGVATLFAATLALAACQGNPVIVQDGARTGTSAMADYCVEQGGRVITRRPVYGTNLPEGEQLALRTEVQFCNFEAPPVESAETDFRSQIEIDLLSLYSEAPTLALLAYLEAPPPDMDGYGPGVNPSTIHCAQLGGSINFGRADDPSGGGWVKSADDATNAFEVSAFCFFADGSAVEAWPITYRSQGVIRGVPLETVVRYKSEGNYPEVYGPPR
jgi:putative hemolysin